MAKITTPDTDSVLHESIRDFAGTLNWKIDTTIRADCDKYVEITQPGDSVSVIAGTCLTAAAPSGESSCIINLVLGLMAILRFTPFFDHGVAKISLVLVRGECFYFFVGFVNGIVSNCGLPHFAK